MNIYQDGVKVYCLPDCAVCTADKDKRNPMDIYDCPEGNEFCTGDCLFYTEEWGVE